MFFHRTTTKSINLSSGTEQLQAALNTADAIIIGAGAGLSTSAGFTYSGERFLKFFSDFREKYGIMDMYSGGFYAFPTQEESWAWWARNIYVNRYMDEENQVYSNLLDLVKDKDYFVLTTNVDHWFQKAGFDRHRLYYTQGDYGLFQCAEPCHDRTYDNKEAVLEMLLATDFLEEQDGTYVVTDSSRWKTAIPTELIPKCPVCGKPMTMNLRCDDTFVEDRGWHQAAERYSQFLRRHEGLKILFLELGVGANTPGIIKIPFWQMTHQNPNATFATINYGEALVPKQIEDRSIVIDGDIANVLSHLSC